MTSRHYDKSYPVIDCFTFEDDRFAFQSELSHILKRQKRKHILKFTYYEAIMVVIIEMNIPTKVLFYNI